MILITKLAMSSQTDIVFYKRICGLNQSFEIEECCQYRYNITEEKGRKKRKNHHQNRFGQSNKHRIV